MKKTIRLTFTEELLGTKASNPDVFKDFIASKCPDNDARKLELDNAEHREEAGTTVFHRMARKDLALINPALPPGLDPEEKLIGVYDYQIKGFFKDACSAMNRFDKEYRNGLEKLAAYKSKIDGALFVFPRFIPIVLPAGLATSLCERPLRAETAQGPRVSLCRSETVPPGSSIVFDLLIMAKELEPYVSVWLDYGKLRGLGQWRNSGKGRVIAEEISSTK